LQKKPDAHFASPVASFEPQVVLHELESAQARNAGHAMGAADVHPPLPLQLEAVSVEPLHDAPHDVVFPG
jgi:hypothetical protein